MAIQSGFYVWSAAETDALALVWQKMAERLPEKEKIPVDNEPIRGIIQESSERETKTLIS